MKRIYIYILKNRLDFENNFLRRNIKLIDNEYTNGEFH
jgi:hypothetical protein